MARSRTRPEMPAIPVPQAAPPAASELAAIMADARARWGEEVAYKATSVPGFRHTPTGVFILDLAMLGGIPEGLVTQIYGWESSGKTTMCLRAAAGSQRKYPDKNVVFIDAENTFDPSWAAHHGVNLDRCYVTRPETGENVVDLVDAVIRAEDTSMIILDSIPAIVPFAEGEKSAEDAVVALRARLCGRMCSKITTAFLKERRRGHWPAVIFVNQWRSKIGVMMGDTRTLPGGAQVQFTSAVKLEMKNKEDVATGQSGVQIVTSNQHSFLIKKNKVGNSLRSGEFTMIRDPSHKLGVGGIDEAHTVVTYAKKLGLVHGGGATWRMMTLDETFRSLALLATHLEDNPDVCNRLQRMIIMAHRQAMGIPVMPPDGYLLGRDGD